MRPVPTCPWHVPHGALEAVSSAHGYALKSPLLIPGNTQQSRFAVLQVDILALGAARDGAVLSFWGIPDQEIGFWFGRLRGAWENDQSQPQDKDRYHDPQAQNRYPNVGIRRASPRSRSHRPPHWQIVVIVP